MVLFSNTNNAHQCIDESGNLCDSGTSPGEVVGGLSEAHKLVDQEAKHGPIKARKFVRRFLECGGALEVQLQLIPSHSSVILSR